MAVMGRLDLAAAVNLTGEFMVLPPDGAQTVTPVIAAVQAEGGGVGVGVGVGVGDGLGVGVGLGLGLGVGVGDGLGVGVGDGLGLADPVNASVMLGAVAAAPG